MALTLGCQVLRHPPGLVAATKVQEALEGISKPSQIFLPLFTTPGEFFSLVQSIAFFGMLHLC